MAGGWGRWGARQNSNTIPNIVSRITVELGNCQIYCPLVLRTLSVLLLFSEYSVLRNQFVVHSIAGNRLLTNRY